MEKYTIKQIEEFFTEQNCKLLSNEYKNSYTKLDFLCANGHKGRISWNKFRQGCRCLLCFRDRQEAMKIATIHILQSEGYTLFLHEGFTAKDSINFLCPQGHQDTKTLTSFQQGHRCAECKGNKKKSLSYVEQVFTKEGYVLLSKEYTNSHSSLKYKCPEGHLDEMTWTDFDQGHRCPKCGRAKREARLGKILEGLFFEKEVVHLDNLGFLGKQKVDYSVCKYKIAFEHDGEQHFRPTRFKGVSLKQAQENFIVQIKRDTCKNQLCQKNGYKLIRIAYYEDLTIESVKKKIQDAFRGEICPVSA